MQRYCIAMAFVALGLPDIVDGTFTVEEGPFEAIVQNVSSCTKEQPWFHTNVTTYISNSRRLLRGSVKTQRQMKNAKFRIIFNYMEGAKVKAFEIKNQNCHNFVVALVLHGIRLRYDAKKCIMDPTSSEFSGLDLDKIIHSVVQSLWYGTVQIRLEIAVRSVTVLCLDVDLQIVKIKA